MWTRYLRLLLSLVVIVAAVVFAVENATELQRNVIFQCFQYTTTLPLGVLLLAVFVAGMVVWFLGSVSLNMELRATIRRLRRGQMQGDQETMDPGR